MRVPGTPSDCSQACSSNVNPPPFFSFLFLQAFHGFKGGGDFKMLEEFFYQEGSLDKIDRWLNAKRNVALKAYWAEVRDRIKALPK